MQVSLTSRRAFLFRVGAVLRDRVGALVSDDTPFGRVLGAVKQNEMRAAYCGHNVWLVKFTVFVMSCAIAGMAGGLFALAQQSAYPNVMSLNNSGYVVMMVLIRRIGQLLGTCYRRGVLHRRA